MPHAKLTGGLACVGGLRRTPCSEAVEGGLGTHSRILEKAKRAQRPGPQQRRLIHTHNFFEKVEVFKRACRRLETAMAQSVEKLGMR